MSGAPRRSVLAGAFSAVLVCTLSGCGGSHKQARQARALPQHKVTRSLPSDEVLAISGLGSFQGRCPRSASSWTLQFVDLDAADDALSYRVGTGPHRTVNVYPGAAISFHLIPEAARTHEPGFVPPPRQGRGLTTATAVPSTAPLQVTIYQATEPQTQRADVTLGLSASSGGSGQCVLVNSTLHAYTYPNSSH